MRYRETLTGVNPRCIGVNDDDDVAGREPKTARLELRACTPSDMPKVSHRTSVVATDEEDTPRFIVRRESRKALFEFSVPEACDPARRSYGSFQLMPQILENCLWFSLILSSLGWV